MTLLIIKHESCDAEVLFQDGIASIQSIFSKTEGKGHAKECLKKIEKIARNKKIKEIWFPTVISSKLEKLLEHSGYNFTNFGKHPMMPDAEDVVGFKLTLQEKSN